LTLAQESSQIFREDLKGVHVKSLTTFKESNIKLLLLIPDNSLSKPVNTQNVTIKQLLSALFLLSILVSGCKKDGADGKDKDIFSPIIEEQNKRLSKVLPTTTTTVFLRVQVEDEDGQPLSGVEVRVGDVSTTTDNDGIGFLPNLRVNRDYAVVSAIKSGYLKGSRTIASTPGSINTAVITLLKQGTTRQFEAKDGASLTFDDNAVRIDFPANAIADAQGKPYSGPVRAYARYLDPRAENFSTIMPGTLVGLTESNSLSGMISYGMVNVEMRDGSNNPLQLAPGMTAAVTMPAVLDAPANMPIWHFNETYGLWVEAGRATKSGSTYSFEANHFSVWNLDIFVEDGVKDVTIEVLNPNQKPMGNQRVEIFNAGFSYRIATVTTDERGQFRLLQTPRQLGFRIVKTCEQIDRLVSLTTPITKVVFTQYNLASSHTISGYVIDCEEEVYKNAPFFLKAIDNTDIQFIGKTDNEGRFNIHAFTCDVDPTRSYAVIAQVFTGASTFKKDTINILFSSNTVQKNVNFCEVKEEDRFELLIDPRDGKAYKTIQIGNQIWFAENLRHSESVLQVTANNFWFHDESGAWCYYKNFAGNDAFYGMLYNWHAVNSGTLCPPGWHIPSDDEWQQLVDYLGGESVAGGKMKSIGTIESGVGLWQSPNNYATNESGFSGLPGGLRSIDFSYIGSSGYWWTSTASGPQSALYRFLTADAGSVTKKSIFKYFGFSCRCVKD